MPQPRTPAGKPAAKASPPGNADPADAGQSHPLHSIDRNTIDRLLAAETPDDADLIDAARLLARYRGFPGASDLQEDLRRAIQLWGLSADDLQARARALWPGGWRVGAKSTGAEPVGSGFDASGEAEA